MSCEHVCNNCIYAKWDYDEGYGHTKFWFVEECGLTNAQMQEKDNEIILDGGTVPEYNEEYGSSVDCPYWEEVY